MKDMGVIRAICISKEKGTAKERVPKGVFIENFGIENDAHAGNWHRQVSFLSYDKVEEFCARGASVDDGAFGENVLATGIDFRELPIGTKLQCNDVVFEITQIGKECHSHCAIYHQVGDCIMPREGIFGIVIHGGVIQEGDEIHVIE